MGLGTVIALRFCSKPKEGNMLHRSVVPMVFASIAGSAPVAVMGTAHAQSVNAYCASVGNDDRVKPIPPTLVPEARHLFGWISDQPVASVQETTVFRCMRGKVWLCNYGANLLCAKGDVSRVSKGADAYCKEFPGSDLVPMAATGHATIYTWKCMGSRPRIIESEEVDARGFITKQWQSSN
jgi:hypothetical protein